MLYVVSLLNRLIYLNEVLIHVNVGHNALMKTPKMYHTDGKHMLAVGKQAD